MQQKSKWLSLVVFFFICICVEFLGGWWTASSVLTWYPNLIKPSFNPPSWLFGPVWTILYFMIAIAGWLIYIQPESKNRTRGLWIYSIQLILNLLWSYFFFFLHSPLLGLIDISFLFLSILGTIFTFYPLSKPAAWLLVPYFLWTGFALILNTTLFLLN